MSENSVADAQSEPCNCIEKFNAKFSTENMRLVTKRWTNLETGKHRTTVAIPVEKINTRNRKPLIRVIPNYCPMCGQRYEAAS